MSAEGHHIGSAIGIQHSDNSLGHLSRFVSGHADLHFAPASSSGKMDVFASDLRDGVIQKGANRQKSIHVVRSPAVKSEIATWVSESDNTYSHGASINMSLSMGRAF